MINNIAFEFLKQHKDVKPEVESLVLKKTRGQLTTEELLSIFEDGIAGKYGKIYSLDAATLLNWVDVWKSSKNSTKNYLETGLLNPNEPVTGVNYPQTYDAWHKEVNKCYLAYISGVSEEYFHPDCYDRLMMDGKILFGSSNKYFDGKTSESYKSAKQKCVRDYFAQCKSRGWNQIYFVR